MIPKLGLENLEVLSSDFAESNFMNMFCKFAVYVYCMEKTALLLVLADTSVSSSFIANVREADCIL